VSNKEFENAEVIAFDILNEKQKTAMDKALSDHIYHSNEVGRAQDDYMLALLDESACAEA
jgi:hypothetical protein